MFYELCIKAKNSPITILASRQDERITINVMTKQIRTRVGDKFSPFSQLQYKKEINHLK